MKLTVKLTLLLAFITSLFSSGCGSKDNANSGAGEQTASSQTIQVEGSDTMVNLAQAWSEKYQDENSDITIEVSGGGSGVGISSLIQGLADMANASRKMKDKEKARAENELGVAPAEYIVGQDALAVYVHKDNPLEEITLEQLEAIYADGGNISKWSELGLPFLGAPMKLFASVVKTIPAPMPISAKPFFRTTTLSLAPSTFPGHRMLSLW